MLPQIYKFKAVVDAGDDKLRFAVLEDRDDRVLVKEVTLADKFSFPPVMIYLESSI